MAIYIRTKTKIYERKLVGQINEITVKICFSANNDEVNKMSFYLDVKQLTHKEPRLVSLFTFKIAS